MQDNWRHENIGKKSSVKLFYLFLSFDDKQSLLFLRFQTEAQSQRWCCNNPFSASGSLHVCLRVLAVAVLLYWFNLQNYTFDPELGWHSLKVKSCAEPALFGFCNGKGRLGINWSIIISQPGRQGKEESSE